MNCLPLDASKIEVSISSEYRWSNANQGDSYFRPPSNIAYHVRVDVDMSTQKGEGVRGGERKGERERKAMSQSLLRVGLQ